MFDIVRNNKKVIQIVLAIIILPFAFFGIESFFSSGPGSQEAARVGGVKVSEAEYQEALREQQDKLRPALGGQDPALLDSPQLRRAVLDSLVQRKLIEQYAREAHLAVDSRQLVQLIASVPTLQEDGQFSPRLYEAFVASRNMSKELFEYKLRQDLVAQQALMAVANASVSGNSGTGRWLAAQLEEREIAEATLRPEQFLAGIKIPEAAVKAYYESNKEKFQLPESVRVEYLVLSREQLLGQAAVGDADIKAWYDSHPERYKQAEERRASHVLIRLDQGASDDQVKAAEAKAAQVLAQLRKAPGDFARLAKEQSQDPGSADKGGDLGWFARGAMVKPFEDAVFALKEGQISEVVRSDFGFHVIKVTGIHGERLRPFDEVRAEIGAELKAQAAAKKYAEAAEGFSNLVYEQPDSLAPAAEKYQLKVEQGDWLSRGRGATGVLAHPKVQAALFSDDAIKNRRNTEAIEVAPNVLVSARVVEHKPAELQPLERLATSIEKLLAHQEAEKLAAKTGEARLAELAKGGKTDLAWGAPRLVSRSAATGLTAEGRQAVFAAATATLPAYVGAPGAGGAYVLYRISRVNPYVAEGQPKPQAVALRSQYARTLADEEAMAWLEALRERFPVEINKAMLESRAK